MKTRTAKPWLYKLINEQYKMAIKSNDIPVIREVISLYQGMILSLGVQPGSIRMYKYLQSLQASLYDEWRAIINRQHLA